MLIDVLLVAVLLFAIFKGLRKGFIVAVFSFIAFIVGLVAALKLSTVVAAYLDDSVNISARWLPFLSFALVFLLVVVLVRLLAAVVESTVEMAMMGWVNRVAGVMLYAVLYIVIFSVLLFFATEMSFLDEETLQESASYEYISPAGPLVIDAIGSLLPWFRDMFGELQEFFTRISEQVPAPEHEL